MSESSPLSVGSFAYNPTPIGLGAGMATTMLAGKGNHGVVPFKPQLTGAYSLHDNYSGKDFDYSNQFKIAGDKGDYNLLRMMADTKPITAPNKFSHDKQTQGQKIADLLKDDPTALAAYNQAYRVNDNKQNPRFAPRMSSPVSNGLFGAPQDPYSLPQAPTSLNNRIGQLNGRPSVNTTYLGAGNRFYEGPAFNAMTRLLKGSQYPAFTPNHAAPMAYAQAVMPTASSNQLAQLSTQFPGAFK